MVLGDSSISRLILDQISTEKTASLKPDNTLDISEAKKISSGLVKVASYPYKEETFHAIQEIMKIASEEINELVDSLEATRSRNSELEKVSEVRVIVEDLINAGYIEGHDVEEKIAELLKKDEKQLSIAKEAIKMASGGKQGNVFSENDMGAVPGSLEKTGMFDGILD